MSQKYGQFSKFDEETEQILRENFQATICSGFLNCQGYTLPNLLPDVVDEILNFDIKDDDTWVVSYPKSGTTWTQETVWCMANNLDFEYSKKVSLSERFPFLDVPILINVKLLSEKNPQVTQRLGAESKLQKINNLRSPRFVKSHLPLDFLPLKLQHNSTNAKIICITRNPRDVCISQFHHCQGIEGFKNTFEEFAELFMKGLVPYGPYWKHVFSYWDQRSKLNILFIRFEDMKTDLQNTIAKISKFVKKPLTEQQIYQLAEHVNFDNMKNIDTVNKEKFTDMMKNLNNVKNDTKFMRCGKINQWRSTMSPQLIAKFEQWEAENLKGSDYELRYEEE